MIRNYLTTKEIQSQLDGIVEFRFEVLPGETSFRGVMHFPKVPSKWPDLELTLTLDEILEDVRKTSTKAVNREKLYKQFPEILSKQYMYRNMMRVRGFIDYYLYSTNLA